MRVGEWQLGAPEQAPLYTCASAGTERIGGRNHYGLLLPVDAENVLLTWAEGPEIALIPEYHDLPASTGARLFHWSQAPAEVRRYGDFQIAFTMMGEPNTTVVRLQF